MTCFSQLTPSPGSSTPPDLKNLSLEGAMSSRVVSRYLTYKVTCIVRAVGRGGSTGYSRTQPSASREKHNWVFQGEMETCKLRKDLTSQGGGLVRAR